MTDFAAQINAWVRKSELRMITVAREAAQDLSEAVQTPRAKGGRMPVDTSFLINSFSAALNNVPRGEADNDRSGAVRDYDFGPISIVLTQAKIGDRIVFGWTANYAPFMEAKYAFLRTNAMRWQQLVSAAAERVKTRVTG